jgi:1,4-alpha-glucan branching enzyme
MTGKPLRKTSRSSVRKKTLKSVNPSDVLSSQQIEDILTSDLCDPFSVLGMHKEKTGVSVRVFRPGAIEISVLDSDTGVSITSMTKVNEDGVFVSVIDGRKEFFGYKLEVTGKDNKKQTIVDPYRFLPVMSEDARYLFNQGNNNRIYDDLGSHLRTVDGVSGTVFAVWAPEAMRVSVVGLFNNWDGRVHQMRLLGSSGIWELFIPGVGAGAVYKYEIKKKANNHLVLKSDPYGYFQEAFPYHGSMVVDLDTFNWNDEEWIKNRTSGELINRPLSIYEVHPGSWRKSGPDEDGDNLSYRELAHQLADYILEMGYTHVELLPVQEHPFVPSWGYQVTGFYAPNHRFGRPEDFQYFVDYMHSRGIGVLIDWVAGHFPKDEHGLAFFDGSFLYEHQDPREGEHKDWGTLLFNFGRHEVRNFLSSNALFWIDKFHIDGLRVDAVASMLYRNYSRKEGEWIPNRFGGAENLEAIEFLQSTNYLVHTIYPGVITIAEESTAWPQVSKPTYLGGLGFTFKWNMGWMHDMLTYFSKDPVFRKYHHNQVTFGLWYAFNENFVLVLSHDEVVHGKKSLLEKMPGDKWRKFANLRALYSYMYGHPGKKLLFMGGEFGMHNEWYSKRSIDWHVLETDDDAFHHCGLQRLVKDLNRMYLTYPAMWTHDFEHKGFNWIDHTDHESGVVSFMRFGDNGDYLVFVCNFTPEVRNGYRIGVPHAGNYIEILNSDAEQYGGAGFGNAGTVTAGSYPWHNQPCSVELVLPPLGVLVFRKE